jgi:diketogulonate reductase-like aldo/keto reductase
MTYACDTRTTTSVSANGAEIPAIGLGTWPMNGRECREAVANALRAGYRHIDTAAMYGNEAAVGAGIRDSGIARDQIFLTTKVWSSDIGEGDLQRSAEASLGRLGVDAVDLLLIHWPNRSIPIAESISALCDAKFRGYARHIGISNFPTALMDEAVAVTHAPLVCNQVEYHPYLDQSKVLAACRRHGMAMVSYCPLGRGGQDGLLDEPAIREIAERHGRSPGQIVLRWHVQQSGVVAVPKSARAERHVENISVFDFTLSDVEMEALSAMARQNGRVVDLSGGPDWD